MNVCLFTCVFVFVCASVLLGGCACVMLIIENISFENIYMENKLLVLLRTNREGQRRSSERRS